eukprot:CAMPEP_0116837430 /NCGR_PEP_ID=MMETSP0418-20121206/8648_1 /TAXON_ID=1158023 /ORGANISM="Astrosyne radiata, Strain 13vi08-1A" /LENGTH=476 /DNA_ID=CAMNT_0004467311 /DNA_START=12 /DNA_END=1442 /DNA_ORIENTATION=-
MTHLGGEHMEETESPQYPTMGGTPENGCQGHGDCTKCSAYGHVCPIATQMASENADEALERLSRTCPQVFTTSHPFDKIRRIYPEDICLGKRLGRGGYCNVFAAGIPGEDLDKEEDSTTMSPKHNGYTKKQYALKQLTRRILVDSSPELTCGLGDLATEAAFLANLQHPHIIKLVGISTVSIGEHDSNVPRTKSGIHECMSQVASCGGFYLVMERLDETLNHRITVWRHTEPLPPRNRSAYYRWFHHVEKHEWLRSLHTNRLTVALAIAQALEYLHSLGIMYRDLKPENVGLDENEKVKLFDFGLATCKSVSSEFAGSRRYMAPEMIQRNWHTKSVDVYSFGVLLWELCSLERPFLNFSSAEHYARVVQHKERPGLCYYWPKKLQALIQKCWSHNCGQRPTMSAVVKSLEEIQQEYYQQQDEKLKKKEECAGWDGSSGSNHNHDNNRHNNNGSAGSSGHQHSQNLSSFSSNLVHAF